MSNDYFTFDTPLTRQTLARSEVLNSQFQAIEDAFGLLPDAIRLNQGRTTYSDDTGAANAYVVTLDMAPEAYSTGLLIHFKPANTNTGASTINVNSLGVKPVKRYDGDDPLAGDIPAGAIVMVGYDGTNFRLVGVHPGEVALAKAWASSTTVVADSLKGARGYAQDASASALAAAGSAASAASSFEAFRGIYYGSATDDPEEDPNGDPPTEGDWYFNTATKVFRVFDGSEWQNGALSDALKASNNLSDIGDVAAARTSLGLGTAAVEDIAETADYAAPSGVDRLPTLAGLAAAGWIGKVRILRIWKASDDTDYSTSSTSYQTGSSPGPITPLSATSKLLIRGHLFFTRVSGGGAAGITVEPSWIDSASAVQFDPAKGQILTLTHVFGNVTSTDYRGSFVSTITLDPTDVNSIGNWEHIMRYRVSQSSGATTVRLVTALYDLIEYEDAL